MWGQRRGKREREEDEKSKKEEGSDDEKYDWDGGDFGVYMREKERKLREQFAAEAGRKGLVGTFLSGVVIWVDGFTNPSREELRRLVYSAGGSLETYFHPRITTHVVATHFPKFKVEQLRKAMSSTIVHQYVVTPEWVVDCVDEKVRLAESKYLVPGLRDETQSVLNVTRTKRNADGIQNLNTTIQDQGPSSHENENLKGTAQKIADGEGQNERDSGVARIKTEPSKLRESNAETHLGRMETESRTNAPELMAVDDQNNDHFLEDFQMNEEQEETTKEPTSRATKGVEEKLHYRSTRENPNFVREYFSSSRLHFIGSFRARYESLLAAVARDRVAIAKDPTLAGRPLVVCHQFGGEISSASYEARGYGVRAGMFFREAVKLCPELEIITYNFDDYERTTLQIYKLFYDFASCVEAVSVDEAYLDVTEMDVPQAILSEMRDLSPFSPAERIARALRRRIAETTGCPASAGIGSNKLLARLATKKAKPDGQFLLSDEEALNFVAESNVRDLPGVGYSTAGKLSDVGIETCANLQQKSLKELQELFGGKSGETLFKACRGQDDRPVEPTKIRKSIGAEASWGVRFHSDEMSKVSAFVCDLASVVAERLEAARAKTKRLTIKVYKRKVNSGLPCKTLGHGPCDIFNRSVRSEQTCSPKVIGELAFATYKAVNVAPEDLRGLGIQAQDLEFQGFNSPAVSANIEKFLSKPQVSNADYSRRQVDKAAGASGGSSSTRLPEGWDEAVFNALPPTIRSEVLREHDTNQRSLERKQVVQAKRSGASKQASLLKFTKAHSSTDVVIRANNPQQFVPPTPQHQTSADVSPTFDPIATTSGVGIQDGIHHIFANERPKQLAPILRKFMMQDGDSSLLSACLEDLIVSQRYSRYTQMLRLISLIANGVGGSWPEKIQLITRTSEREFQCAHGAKIKTLNFHSCKTRAAASALHGQIASRRQLVGSWESRGGKNMEEEKEVQDWRFHGSSFQSSTVEIAGQNAHCSTFILCGEDHTLGNSVRYMLSRRPGVEFAGYSIPHPSEDRLNIRVQTNPVGETAASAFGNAVKDLAGVAGVIADAFVNAVDNANETAKDNDKMETN